MAVAGGLVRAGRLPLPTAGPHFIDSRPRDTLYLSSHRCPFAGLTKKEIGFADFDPFVFGQRPAMRAGAEKCEGALIGRFCPAPARASRLARASAVQFKAGCRGSATHADLFGFPAIYKLNKSSSLSPDHGRTAVDGRPVLMTHWNLMTMSCFIIVLSLLFNLMRGRIVGLSIRILDSFVK